MKTIYENKFWLMGFSSMLILGCVSESTKGRENPTEETAIEPSEEATTNPLMVEATDEQWTKWSMEKLEAAKSYWESMGSTAIVIPSLKVTFGKSLVLKLNTEGSS